MTRSDEAASPAVPPGYEPVDGGRIVVHAADRPWLEDLGLTRLEETFAATAEARGPFKALARLRAPDGTTVFVKQYDFHRGEVWIRSALKLNFPVYSGPRELRNLLSLAEAGLRVPLPLAAGEADEGARRRSFVALRQLSGQPLDSLPAPPTPAARRARIAATADLVRRLHAAGFWHRDLYHCNLFFAEGEPLGLIDCERVGHRRGEAGPRLRWRIKDLAALDYSHGWATRAERLRGLLRYLQADRLDPRSKRLALAVRRKAKRLGRRGAKGP